MYLYNNDIINNDITDNDIINNDIIDGITWVMRGFSKALNLLLVRKELVVS